MLDFQKILNFNSRHSERDQCASASEGGEASLHFVTSRSGVDIVHNSARSNFCNEYLPIFLNFAGEIEFANRSVAVCRLLYGMSQTCRLMRVCLTQCCLTDLPTSAS